ncbi:mersacidin/lichenicidin family type 2 lantibiotic [Streptosporangium roseum]|uniref:mersacidin/lichenicidin family type 2 lantibiotic n=1 Tax=Streptosporangium roseum TaxID=2001 RepID=UPI003321B336
MNSVKAWKDPEYRASLSSADLARIPANPAGPVTLSNRELETVAGATSGICAGAGLTVAIITMTFTVCSGTAKFGTAGCC